MHADTASWNLGLKLADKHALDIKVKQHCILVQYSLLDRSDLFQIHKYLALDENRIININAC